VPGDDLRHRRHELGTRSAGQDHAVEVALTDEDAERAVEVLGQDHDAGLGRNVADALQRDHRAGGGIEARIEHEDVGRRLGQAIDNRVEVTGGTHDDEAQAVEQPPQGLSQQLVAVSHEHTHAVLLGWNQLHSRGNAPPPARSALGIFLGARVRRAPHPTSAYLPPRGGSPACMQLNDITRERLRRLAATRAGDARVLSLFLNLDPREFATAPARATEVRSVLDRAARLVREDEALDHAARTALRADLERVQSELGNGGLDARGAHGLAIFASGPIALFEVLKLSEPVDHDPVIADRPFIEPLSAIGAPERWCVLLVNRRSARLFCGPGAAMQEIELIEDDVHGQHDQGGWSQARYQRSVDKDVADHLRHTAEVAFALLKHDLPTGILVGAPQELANDIEAELHPYLRERLAGRLDIDVEHTSADDVRRAARPVIEQAARAAQDAALARLAEAFGAGSGRAASGLDDVLRAVHEQRVAVLLVEAGFQAPGVECPVCGWLSAEQVASCPADGNATEPHTDVVEAAVERATMQAADVHVLRDRPELASHGHIAAVLRF
jgi:peptide chain release factor subunit 1